MHAATPEIVSAKSKADRRHGRWIAAALLVAIAGCAEPAQFRLNQVELLKIQYQQAAKNKPAPGAQTQVIADILAALFGTPDDPYFPYLLGEDDPARELVDREQLRQAAGPVSSDRAGTQQGLYREHCAHCHGITGDGAGATAAFLNPYPRDFRLGKFKYKSTRLGQPPTDDDLRQIIRNGIPGTAMPSFRTLTKSELDALVNYVKYLTIRGQTERRLMDELPQLKDDELLIDLPWRMSQPSLDLQAAKSNEAAKYEDQLAFVVEDVFLEVIDSWSRRQSTTVPPVPPGLQPQSSDHEQWVRRGQGLFAGKANCAQCHGATGLGDGQTENLDDWTSNWVKGANIDPRDPSAVEPFIEAGAFLPRTIRPRNLRLRVYRGGDSYADLYRRIANGIEGTGMPDSSALSTDEIWSLVAYVLDLPYEPVGQSALDRLQPASNRQPAGPPQ